MRIVVELEGIFEGEEAREIVVSPEEWSNLTVLEAAKHGARVRKGDVVLKLETKHLDREIADLRTSLKLSEIALNQAEARLKTSEKTTPLDLESQRRDAEYAEVDRAFFFDITRPLYLKYAEMSLKVARAQLEYQEEELRQLEKMYKADDITEETEEIVLQRTRDEVEQAKFAVEIAKFQYYDMVKFTIPRAGVQIEDLTKRALLSRDEAEAVLPLTLDEQRLNLDESRERHRKSKERLEKLVEDRKHMTVRAPIDGVVYYGQINRGHPSDSSAMESMLSPKGSVPQGQVLMTIVAPRPMFVRTLVPEADLHDMRPGLKGKAIPTGYPDLRLPVELDRISDIPVSPGRFDGRLAVRLTGKSKLLMPGMTCKLKLVPYLKEDALLVPSKVVATDELDEDKHYVKVLDADGKPVRRDVTIGRKTGEKTEILEGLEEGDEVALDPSKGDE